MADNPPTTPHAAWWPEETMMDWQPIETAPRDGKSFLAYYGMSDDSVPHPIVLVVSWSAYVSEFEPDYFIGDDLENRPISWQPLPAPPSPPADAREDRA